MDGGFSGADTDFRKNRKSDTKVSADIFRSSALSLLFKVHIARRF